MWAKHTDTDTGYPLYKSGKRISWCICDCICMEGGPCGQSETLSKPAAEWATWDKGHSLPIIRVLDEQARWRAFDRTETPGDNRMRPPTQENSYCSDVLWVFSVIMLLLKVHHQVTHQSTERDLWCSTHTHLQWQMVFQPLPVYIQHRWKLHSRAELCPWWRHQAEEDLPFSREQHS